MKGRILDPEMRGFNDICNYLIAKGAKFSEGSPMIGENIGFAKGLYKKCKFLLASPVGRGLNFTEINITGNPSDIKDVYGRLINLVI